MKKKFKIMMVISLIFNLLFIILAAIAYSQYKNLAAGNQLYYDDRTTLFDTVNNINSKDIVMLGDSITNGCEWSELFNNPNVKNRGISGDTAEGVLHRLDSITKGQPKEIFLMIGVNNLSNKDKVSKIQDTYKSIVEKIKKDSPKTKLVLESCLPVNKKEFSRIIPANDNDLVDLNEKISTIAKENNIDYVDLYSNFKDENNRLSKKYTNDGLHLNGDGYLLWKENIKNYIK